MILSEEVIVFLILGGVAFTFISLAVFVVFHTRKKEKERSQNWEDMAKDIGFDFSEEDNSLIFEYKFFKTFDVGSNRKAKNVISGKNGDVGIQIVDYRYTTGSGKNKSHHHYTVCIFTQKGLGLPHIYLRRQIAFLDFLGKIFGGQDIDFVDDSDFSKSFVLQGGSEKRVRKVFNDNVRKGFLEYQGKNFVFEGDGDVFLIHKGQRIKPDEVTSILDDAYKIINLFIENKPS